MLQNELDMSFNYEPILYGEIKSGNGKPVSPDTQTYKLLCIATKEDLRLADIFNRLGEKERLTEMDIIHAQTFPEDYNFMSDSWSDVAYICGMSVPPIMISRIIGRLIEGGVFNVTK